MFKDVPINDNMQLNVLLSSRIAFKSSG